MTPEEHAYNQGRLDERAAWNPVTGRVLEDLRTARELLSTAFNVLDSAPPGFREGFRTELRRIGKYLGVKP